MKDEVIETIKTKNKNLATENKNIRKDFRELKQELDRAKQESLESKCRLEFKVGQLKNKLKDQRSETKDVLRNIENEKAELEFFRVQSMIEKKEVPSQLSWCGPTTIISVKKIYPPTTGQNKKNKKRIYCTRLQHII